MSTTDGSGGWRLCRYAADRSLEPDGEIVRRPRLSPLITVGFADEKIISAAFDAVGKGGTVVITSMSDQEGLSLHLSARTLTLYEKTVKGCQFGSCNPQYDIVKLLRLYDAGRLKLDELITTRYVLDEVNQGYQDLRDGKNIRGIIVYP